MQQFLKFKAGTAGTWILPAEFFDKLLVAVNDLRSPFDVGFGGKSFSSFAHDFKSKAVPHGDVAYT